MSKNRLSGVRPKLVSWLIKTSVPLLNLFRRPEPFPYSLHDLRFFPGGTLGAATVSFLDKRQFDFLTKYETHDIFHTLLGYGTTTTGELRLQAFMWGNRSSSFAGRLLFLIGIVILPELWPQLHKDFARGRQARRINGADIPVLLHENIDNVRSKFDISNAVST